MVMSSFESSFFMVSIKKHAYV